MMSDFLSLRRQVFTDHSTIGELWVDNAYECDCLEDTVRRLKVPHTTAIPAGRYRVIMDWSNRFSRKMPLLLNVPFFTGIRIHGGNAPVNTDGCILLGTYDKLHPDWISNSQAAFNHFLPKLENELKTNEIWINIQGGRYLPEWTA